MTDVIVFSIAVVICVVWLSGLAYYMGSPAESDDESDAADRVIGTTARADRN